MEIVIGAGVAGLMVAARRLEQGADVLVLEAGPRAGGLIATRHIEGCVVEQGPESIQATPELWAWIEALGLTERVVWPDPVASARWLVHRGRLVALPGGLGGLFTTPLWSPWDALRLLAEPLIPARRERTPESLRDLLVRRLGRGVVDAVADAATAGIFGGDPAFLDAEAAMPDLVAWERDHGGLVRGAMAQRRRRPRPAAARGPMFAFRTGNHELAAALAARVSDRLRTGAPVVGVQRAGAGWRVTRAGGEVDEAARVWVTVGPDTAAPWLGDLAPAVPGAPVAAVHLAWGEDALGPDRWPGFGWLTPMAERTDVMGCLWVSSIFPSHAPGHRMLRVILGGTRDPSAASEPPEALVARARRAVAELQGIEAAPRWTDVVRLPSGIPQVPVGHAERLRAVHAAMPGLRLVGWGWRGPGLSAIARDVEEVTRMPLVGR